VGSELSGEVIQGVEAAAGIEAFLILAVTTLHFTVVAWSIGADELVADTQLGGSGLKQSRDIPLAVGKAVGKLKAIVCLDALYPDAPAVVPLEQPFQEVGGGVGALFRIGSQEAQTCELINGGVLEQAKLRVRNAPAGHHLHVYLDPLAGIGHLLIRLGLIRFFLLSPRKQSQLAHNPEQALRAAGIAPLPQPVPQFHHAQVWVAAVHVPDQLQLRLCVLVGMAVGPPGLAGQGCHAPIPAGLPEVDVRPAFVVLPTGTADTIFFCVLHQGLPIRHVLCYTLVHEGYGPLSFSCCLQLQL